MKRSRTTSFAAPSTEQAHVDDPKLPAAPSWRELAPIVAALLAVLEIVETSPKTGPALKAHRSTMRRQGEAAAAIGGREAMEAALRQAADIDPARAEDRTRVIVSAWEGLPGWQA